MNNKIIKQAVDHYFIMRHHHSTTLKSFIDHPSSNPHQSFLNHQMAIKHPHPPDSSKILGSTIISPVPHSPTITKHSPAPTSTNHHHIDITSSNPHAHHVGTSFPVYVKYSSEFVDTGATEGTDTLDPQPMGRRGGFGAQLPQL